MLFVRLDIVNILGEVGSNIDMSNVDSHWNFHPQNQWSDQF